jgi:hypothetical protein
VFFDDAGHNLRRETATRLKTVMYIAKRGGRNRVVTGEIPLV